MARDQLFATLDPTVRRIEDLAGSPVLMSDTVGFIRELPHELVAAFRSTLEETLSASLVVHVIDAADPDRLQQQAVVEEVLDDIGAGELPMLKVFNKVDLTERGAGLERDEPVGSPRSGFRRSVATDSRTWQRRSTNCSQKAVFAAGFTCRSTVSDCARDCSNWAWCAANRSRSRRQQQPGCRSGPA
jgi:hypothetical protein